MSEMPGIMYPRIKLSRFHKLINLTMSRLFKAYGYDITREQEVTLRELRQRDGVNQVDLASRTGQDRNNLSRTLDILESKSLVARDVCSSDKRNSLVYITDEGRLLHEGAYKAVNEYRQILFRGFSQDEVDTFSIMIRRLSENLSSFLEQNGNGKPPSSPKQKN
jgi:DNA-binding MarR family transcriptional regulator